MTLNNDQKEKLIDIAMCIIKVYPDSGLSYKYHRCDINFADDDDILNDVVEFFMSYLLCIRYYDGINVLIITITIFLDVIRIEKNTDDRKLFKRYFKVESVNDDPFIKFMACVLSGAGLIDTCDIHEYVITDMGNVCLYIFKLYIEKCKDCDNMMKRKVDKPAISTRELNLLEEIGILKDENIALKKENKQLKDSLNRINEALKLIDNRFDV